MATFRPSTDMAYGITRPAVGTLVTTTIPDNGVRLCTACGFPTRTIVQIVTTAGTDKIGCLCDDCLSSMDRPTIKLS